MLTNIKGRIALGGAVIFVTVALLGALSFPSRPAEAQLISTGRLQIEGSILPTPLSVLKLVGPARQRVTSDGVLGSTKGGIALRQAVPTTERFGPMSLTLRANGGPALNEWYEQAAANWLQSGANLTLTQYDRNNAVIARWTITGGRPTEISVATNELGELTETVVLAVEGFTRVQRPPPAPAPSPGSWSLRRCLASSDRFQAGPRRSFPNIRPCRVW